MSNAQVEAHTIQIDPKDYWNDLKEIVSSLSLDKQCDEFENALYDYLESGYSDERLEKLQLAKIALQEAIQETCSSRTDVVVALDLLA